jgi:RNA recognition motif-containing protein
MLKNGIKLISRQSSKLNPLNRLLCRSFLTLSSYNNLRALNNNSFPIKISLSFIQNQNMCTQPKTPNTKRSDREIFVGNLPLKVDKESIRELFNKYGKIEKLFLPLEFNGDPKTFAIIAYEKKEDYENVMSHKDDIYLNQRKLNVEHRDRKKKQGSKTSTTLKSSVSPKEIEKISNSTDTDPNTFLGKEITFSGIDFKESQAKNSVREFFGKFGIIKKLTFNKHNGHILYESKEDVDKLLNLKDELTYDGNKVNIDLSLLGKGEKIKMNVNQYQPTTPTVHIRVSNIKFESTEDSIRNIFVECGEIVNFILPKKNEKHKGFCIIEFDSVESATKAFIKNEVQLDGRQLKIKYKII